VYDRLLGLGFGGEILAELRAAVLRLEARQLPATETSRSQG
jgi:hypothetical protein